MGGYHKLKQHIIRTKAMHVNCYCYYYDDCLKNGLLWFYLLRLFQHKDRIIYPTPFFSILDRVEENNNHRKTQYLSTPFSFHQVFLSHNYRRNEIVLDLDLGLPYSPNSVKKIKSTK